MMRMQDPPQSSLFYVGINIDKRVRANHPLRRIREHIDFDFSYDEVKNRYGINGNVSVSPPEILKLILLLVLYNVRDPEIPNHSILSKARKKWGVEIFQSFFERIVMQCVEAGLVNGRNIFIDSSLIGANVSDIKNLKPKLHKNYKKLESFLKDQEESTDPFSRYEKKNNRYISSTDPDAAIVGRGKPKLSTRYIGPLKGKMRSLQQQMRHRVI